MQRHRLNYYQTTIQIQATLWVDRDILEMLNRANHINQFDRRGLTLVDGKHLATFGGVSTFSAPFCKVSWEGACAALEDVQPYDSKKNSRICFMTKMAGISVLEIQLLSPMIDAHGILFFGGGHTGITFDVSDGTDNDYSDFYTHHYSMANRI